ncbi:MAG: methionyl-tRNA formyltransferase [Coriobacteriia bacterium]|nr:methionyl-tRNA formyltransferase [Coriobacteriia bacterium]
MRVVFMGTPEFAVPSLRALAGAHDVVAVYTRPDAVSGRGGKTRPSSVKSAALELGLDVREPATLRDAGTLSLLAGLRADVIIVAAYGLILPSAALNAARLGAINVHASLLPRWRGAAPIQRAILCGDEFAGVSIMRMEEGLDTGPYCLQLRTSIDDQGAVALTEGLAQLGAQALSQALPCIADGSAIWTAQDEHLVTYAEKIAKHDVALSPDLTTVDALRRVRASSPTAPSRIVLGSRGVTVMAARPGEVVLARGAVACTKSALSIGVADGAIELTEIKPDGKVVMDACAWARGVRDLDAAQWGAAL